MTRIELVGWHVRLGLMLVVIGWLTVVAVSQQAMEAPTEQSESNEPTDEPEMPVIQTLEEAESLYKGLCNLLEGNTDEWVTSVYDLDDVESPAEMLFGKRSPELSKRRLAYVQAMEGLTTFRRTHENSDLLIQTFLLTQAKHAETVISGRNLRTIETARDRLGVRVGPIERGRTSHLKGDHVVHLQYTVQAGRREPYVSRIVRVARGNVMVEIVARDDVYSETKINDIIDFVFDSVVLFDAINSEPPALETNAPTDRDCAESGGETSQRS